MDLFDEAPSDAPPAASGLVGPRRNVVVGMASWADPSLIKSKGFYPRGHTTSEKLLLYYAT